MDDIVITRSDSKGILSLKSFLNSQFHTKDLEMLKYFLGVEVMRSKQGIIQRKYVLDMLSEIGKLGAKPCSTPMAPNVQLTKEWELFEDPKRYRRLVGKLNYLTITRLDIAYSVSVLSQYMSSPTVNHWAAIEHSLYYLKEAPGRGILYKKRGIPRLSTFLTQIGQDLRKIGDPPQDIVSFLEEIRSHGTVRSKVVSRDLVRSQSIELWHSLYARSCGYVSY